MPPSGPDDEHEEDRIATLLRPELVAPSVANRTCTVRVVAGKDAGKAMEVDRTFPTRMLLGQSQACTFRLTDPSVSRRHAALEVVEHGVRLTDLGSTNGTRVGALRIVEALLGGGESVHMGDTTLSVELRAPAGRTPLSTAMRFGGLIGGSVEMRRLYPLCERIAASDVPLIIEGESGTGKEVLAEAIHDASTRANAPFVVFDCTAVPAELFESALFGHEKGAFTGAVSARKGAFEQAHTGTLFIDEIGDLAPNLQSKLLRAIERSEVQRVGADRWTRADVRIIAATRRDLDREVASGGFRDDLFFRLSVTRIELPPLRRRATDVELLTRHFWRELGGRETPLPPDLLHRFEAYDWPGNIRELRNAVARHLALGDLAAFDYTPREDAEPSGEPGDLVTRVLGQNLPLARARQQVVEEFERLYVEKVLAAHGGNVRRAAAASGLARRYFQVLKARRAPK